MDPIVENYQLKWHSFSSYLHSCIATSIHQQNDNNAFADVALVTIDGRQIMAHRFVLSACSQYLNQILKLQPKITTTLPLMIVLPPEINYRTLKTLIQYMYSGEATVSKDILEPVLRGGDILKVKGLWRPKDEEDLQSQQQQQRPVKVQQQQQQHELPNNKKIKDGSKVVNYTIMKNVNNGKATTTTEAENNKIKQQRQQQQQQNSVIKSTEEEKRMKRLNETPPPPPLPPLPVPPPQTRTSNECKEKNDNQMQYLVIKEEPIEWSDVCNEENQMELIDENKMFNTTEMTIKPEIFMDETNDGDQDGGGGGGGDDDDNNYDDDDVDDENNEENTELYSPLTCELCTETFNLPAEWVRHVQTHTDMLPAKRQRRGRTIPDDEVDAPYPQLHCDLCQKYFPTPAEWVHHIQNTHTEFELHLSNKIAPPISTATTHGGGGGGGNKIVKIPRSFGPAQNSCTICTKKFPSHASLLIHKRTHTGEKPYMCELCCKGFNVKSNLLRHLRTVHDKIINPTEIDDTNKDDLNHTNTIGD